MFLRSANVFSIQIFSKEVVGKIVPLQALSFSAVLLDACC